MNFILAIIAIGFVIIYFVTGILMFTINFWNTVQSILSGSILNFEAFCDYLVDMLEIS